MKKDGKSLIEEIDRLKHQLQNTQHKLDILQEEKEELSALNQDLEEQNMAFTHLAVTFHRLFSTKNYVEVISIIKEILTNLIGIKHFEIHVLDKAKNRLTPITHEGEKYPISAKDQHLIDNTLSTGSLFVSDEKRLKEKKKPIACIPLKIGKDVLGIIVINQLMIQKKGFTPQDEEVFSFLGNYASVAIYFSKLNWIIESEIKRKLRDGVVDLTPPTPDSMRSIVSTFLRKK